MPRKKFFVSIGVILWSLTAIFAVLPFWPHLYYRLFPQVSDSLASTIASTVSQQTTAIAISPTPTTNLQATPSPTPSFTTPELELSLPKENGLIIEKIGVRGEIHEGSDWEEILKQGVWRVPDFGSPEDTTSPIILAAHRWGYLDWSASFRKLNSFYNLPSLKVDETIKIIWNQRQYEYKVYSTSSGTEISDYDADLILYTCQLWNSPARFFVYARRTK